VPKRKLRRPAAFLTPATTTRSDRGFELSPRMRLSKIVMRNPPALAPSLEATQIALEAREPPSRRSLNREELSVLVARPYENLSNKQSERVNPWEGGQCA